MKVINLLVIVSLMFSISCKEKQERENIQEIVSLSSAKEFKENTSNKEVQLIDVRTPKEFAEGHIKNAKNINFRADNFLALMNSLDKEKPVYLYCRSGGRSGNASNLLRENGFKQIVDLDGGILDWKAQGFEIIKK